MMQVAFGARSRPLVLNADNLRALTSLEPTSISVSRRCDPGRAEAEALIEKVYARKYGASISRHYPSLMSVHGAGGAVLAAVGFRAAADESLFLENYLDEPIESALSKAADAPVRRSTIVEIGSLAGRSNGASVFLFVTLAALLRHRRFTHAVATATSGLQRVIEAFDFRLLDLGTARPDRLSDRGRSWGRYYGAEPKVLAGEIEQCFARLAHYLPPERNPDLDDLFLAGECSCVAVTA